jgi:hypothetical protein
VHSVHFDRRRMRLHFEGTGFWDLAEAMTFYTEVTVACREARKEARPLSILADLSDYLPQGGPVSDTHERTVAEIRQAPLDRYALVAPSALNRMRIRRMLVGIPHQIFTLRGDAAAWLGWTDDYLRLMPGLPMAAAPSALSPAERNRAA